MSPLLESPAAMRSFVLETLLSADAPMRGRDVQAAVAAVLSEADRAIMQNARGNGREETFWQNCVYRAFRQLKAHGLVSVVAAATYELTDAGRDAAKGAL